MEINKIYQGNTLDVLKTFPDECVDLIFADPPFNVGKNYGKYKDRRDNYYLWCNLWIKECFRVLKKAGSFYMMTLSKHLPNLLPEMSKYGVFINVISWRNVSANHTKRAFWNEYQPIMFYGKTKEYIFNTYAETFDTGIRRWGGYSTEYKGQLKDRWDKIPFVYAGSIKHKEAILIPGTNKKVHPCQMPLGIVRRAIKFSTNEKAVILDPFIGSGTSAVAAQELNRNYVGVDLNPEYIKLAEERINKVKNIVV